MPAARVGDPIAHSNAGLGMLLGALAGVAAGALLVGATIATGGAALAVVAAVGGAAALTSFGGLSGMYVGAASMGPPTGMLAIGSPNVFINGRPATMTAMAMAMCSKDPGPIPLATGSSSVMINIGMAGREGETMGCSAKVVAPCSPDVIIGGPSAQDPRVAIQPEVPQWAVTGLQVLGIAGAIMALPYSIAALGVGGTLAAGVLGYGGSILGGKAGRALGEAMGLSQGGVLAMEAAGELGGGMLGGAAGARGWQAGTAGWNPATRAGVITKQGWSGGPPGTVAQVNRMPPAYRAEYAQARAAGWKRPDGSTWWPPENGAVPGSQQVTTLPKGTQLDRYGGESGGYLSPRGASFESRAMPGVPSTSPNNYVVNRPLSVEQARIAPWFEQPGGGTQYRLTPPDGWPPGKPFNVGAARDEGFLGILGP